MFNGCFEPPEALSAKMPFIKNPSIVMVSNLTFHHSFMGLFCWPKATKLFYLPAAGRQIPRSLSIAGAVCFQHFTDIIIFLIILSRNLSLALKSDSAMYMKCWKLTALARDQHFTYMRSSNKKGL